MDYSTLNDLIDCLEYGTRLHIGVLFFGAHGNEKLSLPSEKEIHTSPICAEMKSRPNGYKRCFYCRNSAIKKALSEKKPFGGLCINGIYEYTRPVVVDDEVVSIIFIGNILPNSEDSQRLYERLSGKEDLIKTAESDFTIEKCETAGRLIESYIRMILDLCPSKTAPGEFDPLLENLKSYIEANLEYDIDISLLAKIFHYNEKYLGRLFKKKTGLTFSEWVNLRRIERGRELLTKTGDTVITISMKVGFSNVTYFNRVFKKHYGVTPSEYRKKK